MARVVHFDITAGNPERAAEFYKKVFGWKITKWDGPMDYWMIETGKGPGINGGLMKADQRVQRAITIGVESVDKTLEKVKKAGGSTASEKSPIPGYGWLAFFKDTEGNVIGIMQEDKKAM